MKLFLKCIFVVFAILLIALSCSSATTEPTDDSQNSDDNVIGNKKQKLTLSFSYYYGQEITAEEAMEAISVEVYKDKAALKEKKIFTNYTGDVFLSKTKYVQIPRGYEVVVSLKPRNSKDYTYTEGSVGATSKTSKKFTITMNLNRTLKVSMNDIKIEDLTFNFKNVANSTINISVADKDSGEEMESYQIPQNGMYPLKIISTSFDDCIITASVDSYEGYILEQWLVGIEEVQGDNLILTKDMSKKIISLKLKSDNLLTFKFNGSEGGTVNIKVMDKENGQEIDNRDILPNNSYQLKMYARTFDKRIIIVKAVPNNKDYRFKKWTYPNSTSNTLTLTKEMSASTISPEFYDIYVYITTADELIALADKINKNTDPEARNLSYKLKNDIDFGGKTINPIGGVNDHPFNGVFNGNGFSIKNVRYSPSSVERMAFIGETTTNAKVVNLTIDSTVISDCQYGIERLIAGVVALNRGVISNCVNRANITGVGRSCGGIVGKMNDGGAVYNSYNYGDISGSGYLGGIAGVMSNNSIVKNSYNTGEVSSPRTYIAGRGSGGIVGMLNDSGVFNSYNTGNVWSRDSAGGIVGVGFAHGSGVISNCYNTGSVGADFSAGGVTSWLGGAHLYNVYNTGDVSCLTNESAGIALFTYNGSKVINAYSSKSPVSTNSRLVGGLFASVSANDENCYFVNTSTITTINGYNRDSTVVRDATVEGNGGWSAVLSKFNSRIPGVWKAGPDGRPVLIGVGEGE